MPTAATTKVYVDLATELDSEHWRRRHLRDEVPDATPYGLDRLEHYGVELTLRDPAFAAIGSNRGGWRCSAALGRVARTLRHRTGGAQFLEAALNLATRTRRQADVVLCYDERTGVPSALTPSRLGPPTVTGVGWLSRVADADPAMARLARLALPRAALVWTQCAPVLPLLRSEWGVAPSRIRFVPFGIDTDFYRRQPPPQRPDVVVSAGEDRYRDHQLLVDAVAALRGRHPGIHLELATGTSLRLPDGLVTQHTGRLDGAMRAVYQRGSVVAIALKPTVTGSGLSVVLEAMASGRPVVVTANPGIDDYVAHNETGLLVPAGDQAAMSAAISELLADPQRAAELGAAGAARVRANFTSEIMARQLAELLTSV
ncbi:glycosyltransferase involved in cell wall bisynthesis [Jatrophihabitans sp. GAS493]|uniref:glycosyltransferase family 4 protein n=1 Tax=Jatrophihabitans sp. GAS493 TaxID=1907575 RepID=UPI000BB678C5|nr:glycosyltransferase family 4 protein [Jatrophihabitans sp. GAS493]SOD75203.1 glycosyltransferase involved in cell wall bisynthesis [Jatrophihabitans sp. GAS493]